MTEPIDLAPFAERVNGAVADGCPMLIATANDGQPDLSLRGSLMVWDRDHLAFWERALLESYAALQRNPKIAAFYRSTARKEPYLRFYGEALLVEDAALREQVWDRVVESEKKSDPEKKGAAFLIRVDRVRQGRDVIQQRG
ncbi:MAG TPA: pyridoxamine 5'-phosphate oxidase family protein [Candidatus Limnocylindria bacterium]|nr:pyridoxamine 5'-phosphate oxidase family protein [Candidatus Limnocylindria bacterium]